MKTQSLHCFWLAVLLTGADATPARAQTSNLPPKVSIVWPSERCGFNYLFGRGNYFQIKADAADPDGSISQVQFFSDTNLIGIVTNAPFSVVWRAVPTGSHLLKAVAFDNMGASGESSPVFVGYVDFPSAGVFEIWSPTNGAVFATSQEFLFIAELLAGAQDLNPVEFFVGTNSVGVVTQSGTFTAATPPYSLAVSDIAAGEYRLAVRQYGYDVSCFAPGLCEGPVIRVTKLGLQSPRLSPDNRFEFNVVTSFPTNRNVIETSSNLLNWIPISTNVPFTNTFTFTDASAATNSPRFYRAVVPYP